VFTLFSVPKAFQDHIGVIQTNAIRSWTQLNGNPEVILFGDELGTAEIASQYGLRHIPEIRLSEYGTPLVSSVFETAQQVATHDWLCYINCDVIATSDLSAAIRRVAQVEQPMLMSGRRWRLTITEPLDIGPGWERRWRSHVRQTARRGSLQCMDYFVFRRGLFGELPDFSLGRGRWDSYLPYHARELGARFIDATPVVMVAHQDHAFDHPGGKSGLRHSVEGVRNGKRAAGRRCSLGDADLKLTRTGVRRAIDIDRMRWRLWSSRDRTVLGWPMRQLLERDKTLKRWLVGKADPSAEE
jgi:hypothetical protein